MKVLIVYDSVFGNTEKIARALARGMEKQGIKIGCVKVDEVDIEAQAVRPIIDDVVRCFKFKAKGEHHDDH